ncbi:ROK family protein [bacterium]|nr:ROK family protein [bacterium]
MKEHVIGIDLGGTKVEACLMDGSRTLLERRRVFSEPGKGIDAVIDTIVGLVQTVAGGTPVGAVGMGTPGTFDAEKNILFGSPHTPVYETPGFIARTGERLGVPVVVENDANCLALAEFYETCAGTFRYVMAVILGTGMGCGLMLDNRLYRGPRGGAGEIGHTSIDINGRLCTCGRRGCAEAYLSGPCISSRYREMTGLDLAAADIGKRYDAGDAAAAALLDESCRMLGEVLANAVNMLDLEAVILGGGVSNLPVWYEKTPAYMRKSFFGPPRNEVPILKAQLGDSAGVFGAAYLALRELGVMDF